MKFTLLTLLFLCAACAPVAPPAQSSAAAPQASPAASATLRPTHDATATIEQTPTPDYDGTKIAAAATSDWNQVLLAQASVTAASAHLEAVAIQGTDDAENRAKGATAQAQRSALEVMHATGTADG